jgi:urease accessory protein
MPHFPIQPRQAARGLLVASVLVGLSTAAQAHTGHGTHSLMAGLAHPLGLDHLLAMVAVGVWSVFGLPTGKAWWGPATFLLALLVSAAAATAGATLPLLEHAIALSVVVLGALLALAHRGAPWWVGTGLVALAAALHGLAHGAEAPATGHGAYALGFLLTTVMLHTGGVGLGVAIRRWLAERSGWALAGLGTALGVTGLALVTQL